MPRVTSSRTSLARSHPCLRITKTRRSPETQEIINLQIKSYVGRREKIRFLEIESCATIGDIKRVLQNRSSIPIADQVLTFNGKELSDNSVIKESHIPDHGVLGFEHIEFVEGSSQDNRMIVSVVSKLRGREDILKVDVKSCILVLDLKKAIAEQTSIASSRQHIKHGGIVLQDRDCLSDYNIQADSLLYMDYDSLPADPSSFTDLDCPPGIQALATFKDLDDPFSTNSFYMAMVLYWFPPHENFVVFQGPTGLDGIFSIYVTNNRRLVFIFLINPSSVAPRAAVSGLKYALAFSMFRTHSQSSVVGVTVVGKKWISCPISRVNGGFSYRMSGWKSDIWSQDSFRRFGACALLAKRSVPVV